MLLVALLLFHGLAFMNCVSTAPAFEAAKEADVGRSIPAVQSKPPESSDDDNYVEVFDRIHQLAANREQFFARAASKTTLPTENQAQLSVDRPVHSQIKRALSEGVGLEYAATLNLLDADVGAAKSLIELAAEKQVLAENLQQQLLNDGKKLIVLQDLENDKKYKENTQKLIKLKDSLEALPDLNTLYERFQNLRKARLAAVNSWRKPSDFPEKPKGFFFWLKNFIKKITLYHLFTRNLYAPEAIDLMARTVELENEALVHILTNERATALRHLKAGEHLLKMAKNMRDKAHEAGCGPIYMENFRRYTQATSRVDSQRINHLIKDELSGISYRVKEVDQIVLHLLKKLEDAGAEGETFTAKAPDAKKMD